MDSIPRCISCIAPSAISAVSAGAISDSRNLSRLIAILVLVIAGGIFSGAETALSYCNRTRLKTLAADGNKAAARVTAVTDSYDKAIVTLLIVINIIHVTCASVSTVLCISLFGEATGSVISTAALTLIMFLFSETIPKNIAKANSDSYAMGISWLILSLSFVLTPICAFFTFVSNIVKKLLSKGEKAPSMTEDELSDIIESVEEDGVLEPEESKIIRSAIGFGDLRAKDVMTVREDIVAVEHSIAHDELRSLLIDTKYSRLPVYSGSIDKITGVLQSIDYIEATLGGGDAPSIDEYSLPPYRVPPDIKLNPLLEGMTRRHMHLAIVTGIGGTTLGVVTMEDILRELVGDSSDDEGTSTGEMSAVSEKEADR